MNKNEIYDALTEIFRDVFEDDSLVLTPELTAADVRAWDSLNHVRLIVSIEEAFSITFSALEIAELKKVDNLVTLLLTKKIHSVA